MDVRGATQRVSAHAFGVLDVGDCTTCLCYIGIVTGFLCLWACFWFLMPTIDIVFI